jgi:hypothetical protein
MKTFRNIEELKEYYFPIMTKMEREEKFMRTATPAQIGEKLAEDAIKKLKKVFDDFEKEHDKRNKKC